MTTNQLQQINIWVGWIIFIFVSITGAVLKSPTYGPLCIPWGIALALVVRFLIWPVIVLLIGVTCGVEEKKEDQNIFRQKK